MRERIGKFQLESQAEREKLQSKRWANSNALVYVQSERKQREVQIEDARECDEMRQ